MVNTVVHAKNWIKKKIGACGILRLGFHLFPSGAVILRYHSVQQDPRATFDSIGSGITHSATLFSRQIEHVAKYYQPVSLDEILNALGNGRSLPLRAVAITFDDGFRDNAEVAVPILNKVGVPATFYITVGAIDTPHPPWYIRLRKAFYNTGVDRWTSPDTMATMALSNQEQREAALVAACGVCARLVGKPLFDQVASIEQSLRMPPFAPEKSLMMDWYQIKKIQRQGHIIGSHTMSHPNMAYLAEHDVYHELNESKKQLEKRLGGPSHHFSYPSPMLEPHWTEATVLAAEKVGYRTSTTCTAGNVMNNANPLALKRMWVPFNMEEFAWYLDNTMIGRRL